LQVNKRENDRHGAVLLSRRAANAKAKKMSRKDLKLLSVLYYVRL